MREFGGVFSTPQMAQASSTSMGDKLVQTGYETFMKSSPLVIF